MNINLSNEFHQLNKNCNVQLNEQLQKNENTLCIEGRYFSVKIEGENLDVMQEKIRELHQYPSITLRQFYAKLLDIDEEKLQIDPQFTSIIALQSIALQQMNLKKEVPMDSYAPLFPVSVKTLKEETIETFDNLQKKEKQLLSRIDIIEKDLADWKEEEIHKKALGLIGVIGNSFKKSQLEKKIKAYQVQMLQTLFKIHQQITVSSDESSQSKAKHRLAHMLELAIYVDQLSYVNELIKGGVKLNDYHLYMATIANSEKLIRRFVQEGLDPNTRGKDGAITLLYISCLRGQKNAQATKALVDAGADLELPSLHGSTPIHEAIHSDLPSETILELLTKVKDVDIKGEKGESLLDAAIFRYSFRGDISILQALLKMGANPNCTDEEGMTPLHKAIKYIENEEAATKAVTLLMESGAVSTVSNNRGQTPLHFAAEKTSWSGNSNQKDSDRLVQKLIAMGAKVNAQDKLGIAPLHEAVRYGTNDKNTKALETLLNAGANPDIQDSEGNTPLHIAVEMEHVKRVKLLLKHGANRHIRNTEGKLPGGMGIFGRYISEKKMKQILDLLAKI